MDQPYPILEFDPAPEAFREPRRLIRSIDAPEHCVLCFFADVIQDVCAADKARTLHTLRTEIGAHPLYEISFAGRRLAVMHPGVGAPLAAGFLEEAIALGCRKFIACGGAGVLAPDVAVGHVIVPTAAVRDEGTSYHYLTPGREVAASAAAVAAIVAVLQEHGVPYVTARTWTTDAIYRETAAKIARRRDEGCVTVEMEAAAFFAVAQFRGVPFAQLLYAGDDLSGSEWDSRDWTTHSSREMLFHLAAEACLRL
jgi:uridine phosphorylase